MQRHTTVVGWETLIQELEMLVEYCSIFVVLLNEPHLSTVVRELKAACLELYKRQDILQNCYNQLNSWVDTTQTYADGSY